MTSTLLIEQSPFELRAALLVDEKLTRLWFIEDALGQGCFLGRVRRIDKKLQAAFVDVGFEKEGFLPLGKKPDCAEGQAIAVQVKRPPIGDKGPYLKLLPKADVPVGVTPPAKLDPIISPVLEAYNSFVGMEITEIIVSGGAAFSELEVHLNEQKLEYEPELIFDQNINLFERYGVEEQIEAAFLRVVELVGGGRLVIDEAEAMSVVDIDIAATQGQSKRGSIIKACSAAVPEILRQLQLRRIGGQVVLDFPSLAVKGGGQIQSLLKQELKKIKGGRLARVDDSGLAVLILPRHKSSLLGLMTDWAGEGPIPGRVFKKKYIAAALLRDLMQQLESNKSARFEVCAAKPVIEYLNGQSSLIDGLVEKYGRRITLQEQSHYRRGQYDVREI